MQQVMKVCQNKRESGEFKNKKVAAAFAFKELNNESHHSSKQVKHVFKEACELNKNGSNTYYYNFYNENYPSQYLSLRILIQLESF